MISKKLHNLIPRPQTPGYGLGTRLEAAIYSQDLQETRNCMKADGSQTQDYPHTVPGKGVWSSKLLIWTMKA